MDQVARKTVITVLSSKGLRKAKYYLFFLLVFLTVVSVNAFAEPSDNLLFYCDLYEGYDNNVNLDSSRKGDLFSEIDLELGYVLPFAKKFNGTIDYYLGSVVYHDMTDATFYDNNLSLGLDSDIVEDKLNLALDNIFEYNYYPNEEASTYISYSPQLSLRHNFNEAIFHVLSYDFAVTEYSDRKAVDGAGVKKESARQDIRNGITYELGGLAIKDIFFKVRNQYYVNDSNDQFMDYYDYWSYRFNVTAILPLFKDRLCALVGAGYQRFDYDTRQLVNDKDKTEKDDLYSMSASILFDLTKRFSMSLNYTYRQNESNEPSEEYSGSIFSAGLHYAF